MPARDLVLLLLAAAALWTASAVFWRAAGGRAWKLWLVAPLLFAILLGINLRSRFLDVRYAKGQEIAKEVFTRWNSFSRVGVDRIENGEYWIRIDADAAPLFASNDFHGASSAFRSSRSNTSPARFL